AVHRALAKSPEKRHADCAAFARSVTEALKGVGVLAEVSDAGGGTARSAGVATELWTSRAATPRSPSGVALERPARRLDRIEARTDTWKSTREDTRVSRESPPLRKAIRRKKIATWAGGIVVAAGMIVAAFGTLF